MRRQQWTWWCCCLAALLLLVPVVGCGPSTGEKVVTGTVVDGGTPITIPEDQYDENYNYIEVELMPVDDQGNPDRTRQGDSASCAADGTFELIGAQGNGILPGKYKIGVTKQSEAAVGQVSSGDEEEEEEEEETADEWQGKYSVENSQLIMDINGGNITVDIQKINPAAKAAAKPAG